MIPDMSLDCTSMFSLGWLRESIDFPTPQSQSNTITVPGRNSPIRFTEALGRVSYQTRSFSVTLSMLGTRERFNSMITVLANKYTGQLTKVILSNAIKDTVATNQTLLEEYIRFKGALIELGKVGNAFTTELPNEELAFKENGQTISYISN